MTIDARLNKLMPALSARERGILVLESFKSNTPEDPFWRATISSSQTTEFNRLIELMNGTVIHMGEFITLLEQQVDKLELRQCWLVSLVLWDEQVTAIRRATRLVVKEPISQSEYEAKQAELDEDWVPVSDLADVLAGKHDGWTDADYEEIEDWDEPVISDEAWERVGAEKEKVIREAVKSGQLTGSGRGARLCVQEGAFNAWAGTSTTPVPDQLLSYRLVADSEADAGASERRLIERLLEALDSRPLSIKDDPEQEDVLGTLAGHLRKSLAGRFADLWQAVTAVDVVLADVAEKFDGADPIRPDKREVLEKLRARLHGLGKELIYLDVEIEVLEEQDEELIDSLRTMVKLD